MIEDSKPDPSLLISLIKTQVVKPALQSYKNIIDDPLFYVYERDHSKPDYQQAHLASSYMGQAAVTINKISEKIVEECEQVLDEKIERNVTTFLEQDLAIQRNALILFHICPYLNQEALNKMVRKFNEYKDDIISSVNPHITKVYICGIYCERTTDFSLKRDLIKKAVGYEVFYCNMIQLPGLKLCQKLLPLSFFTVDQLLLSFLSKEQRKAVHK